MKRIALAALSILLPLPSTVRAQCAPGGPPNPPAVKRAIVGIVMDSAHQALENAEVIIRTPKRTAKTDARGVFRLDDLEPGTYELLARRIGYEMAQQSYIVTDSGGVARFCLFADVTALPAMITAVPRGGITGVVGDTTLALVSGAEVRVLGENMIATTDSAGAFFFPVKPGQYSVTVKKKGYGTQVVGVTVPKDSGRKVVVWLGSPPRNPNGFANAVEGMRMRILMTPAHRYHRVTAEQLAATDASVHQVAQVRAMTAVADTCPVSIAGTGFSLPLYALAKEEISLLEVVGGPIRGARNAPTSINGMRPVPNQGGGGGGGCPQLIAWLKP